MWQLPLTEIAYRWGFNDSSHFSRSFKAAFGCTAREFRARETGARPQTIHRRDDEPCAFEPLAPGNRSGN